MPARGRAAALLTDLLALGYVPVVASIGVDGRRRAAQRQRRHARRAPGAALGAARLVIAGTTPGVLDAAGADVPTRSTPTQARAMVAAGTARDGMVAKLRACLDALAGGVGDVRIVDGRARRLRGRARARRITNSLDRAVHQMSDD